MAHRTYKASFAAFVLLGSLALAPAAHAEGRETGIGAYIAQQGDQALAAIRADLQAAVQVKKPALPKPRPRKVSLPADTSGGATIGVAASVRCAE